MEEPVRVLVIEDDRVTAEMYCLRLRADGYEVILGSDGEEGLRLAMSEAPTSSISTCGFRSSMGSKYSSASGRHRPQPTSRSSS